MIILVITILIFNGLPMHYNLLKKYVFENNLIGMILYGADIKSELNIITTLYSFR